MLLGLIAGGTIQLLITQVVPDGGGIVKISAAALAFLAGYNCDFLCTTIDRISAAILPKVVLETVRRDEPPTITRLSLNELPAAHFATAHV